MQRANALRSARPSKLYHPDVTVDISRVTVSQDGENRVRVDNIEGKPRPEKLKLSIGYFAGYRVSTLLSFAWPDAYEKAQYTTNHYEENEAQRS